ncbi:isoprenylcysteine carboxylmethyltransferase family protein [Fodinicola feengrottensis]|uniref:Isoprenylcysteine carboxylmethyltransferase family protein n=1 Tax=Fodinicola feengrottensis TaxID=435914 RepID=A0ABP4UZX9_9ACTN
MVAPGTVEGLIPWLLTGWRLDTPLPGWTVARVVGVVLIVVGLIPPISAFVEFTRAGGTPMPAAAPGQLVVCGFNRYIRNPMYFGLLVALVGQALLFGQVIVLAYAAIVWALSASFVRWYEEPTLTRRFGTEYAAYRRAVPAWYPRLVPYVSA